MATESKAVDLGKLQDEVLRHTKMLSQWMINKANAKKALERAQSQYDNISHNVEVRKECLDKAKQAVLDGARSVAQG